MHHAEIAKQLLLRVAALLLADDHDRLTVEPRESADHRLVVGIAAVAVEFNEVGRNCLNIVECVRALGVPGELDTLPTGQVGVNLFAQPVQFLLQRSDLGIEFDILPHREVFHIGDALLQLHDGSLEIEIVLTFCHTSGYLSFGSVSVPVGLRHSRLIQAFAEPARPAQIGHKDKEQGENNNHKKDQ